MRKHVKMGIMLLLLIGFACSKGNHDNEKVPIKEYQLQEELSIDTIPKDNYMLVRPTIVKADKNGNIFVLDWKTCKVTVFDNRGGVLRSIGEKGIGPHEVSRAGDMAIDKNSKIHVLDSKMKKIVRYTFEGVPENDIKLFGTSPDTMWVTEKGNYIIAQTLPTIQGRQMAILAEYDANGQKIRQSHEFIVENLQSMSLDTGNGNTLTATTSTPFDPAGYFTFASNWHIYYGYSDGYQISMIDPMFKESIVINRRVYDRLTVSSKEREEYLQEAKEGFEKRGVKLFKIAVPEYHQVFRSIWTDNDQRLLVRLPTRDLKVYLDAYDLSGRYLEKMVISPLTDGIDIFWIFNTPYFHKNIIYAIVQNEEGQYFIKRYKLIPSPVKS